MMSLDTRVSEAQGAQDTQFKGLEFVEADSSNILNSVFSTLVGILKALRGMRVELSGMGNVTTKLMCDLCMGVSSLVRIVLDNDLAALRGELVRDLLMRDSVVGTEMLIDDLLVDLELLATGGIKDFKLKQMVVMSFQVQGGYIKDMMRRLLR